MIAKMWLATRENTEKSHMTPPMNKVFKSREATLQYMIKRKISSIIYTTVKKKDHPCTIQKRVRCMDSSSEKVAL